MNMNYRPIGRSLAALLIAIVALWTAAPVAAQNAPPVPTAPAVAAMNVAGGEVQWSPTVNYAYARVILTVSGPDGATARYEFPAGQTPALRAVDANATPLPDGLYTYELQIEPAVSPEVQAAFAAAMDSHDPAVAAQLQAEGKLPPGPFGQTGTLTVQGGSFVTPAGGEGEQSAAAAGGGVAGEQTLSPDATLAQVISDDLVVVGSQCLGFDCVAGEDFGFDTLRLKENNTRIRAMDTSTGGFPTVDWQITFNDSASGGANKFAIESIDNSAVPFTVLFGAPTNSLFVGSGGQVGLGTATPVLSLHMRNGNTPAIRLEQDGTSGFSAQTWDVAGNEAGYFVRDVTGGSQLPFRIQPGADSNSLTIENTNDVGVGTVSPSASLHVRRTNGTAQLLVEETNATSAPRELVKLVNANGNALMRFVRGDNATSDWKIGSRGSNFSIDDSADGTAEFFVAANGNITILGTMTTGGPTCGAGCRQQGDLQVRSADLLAKLAGIPMLRWNTTTPAANDPDAGEVTVAHISPDMQSFYEAYGLGVDGLSVAPLDVAAVALASAQALHATVEAQDAQIAALEAQVAALQASVERLEGMAHTHNYLPTVIK